MEKISIFDVDQTLAKSYYILKFAEHLAHLGLFISTEAEALGSLLNDYRNGLSSYSRASYDVVLTFARGVKGMKQEKVETAGRHYIKTHEEELFSFTRDLLALLKAEKFRIIAVTASPVEVMGPFSESLGIDATFATVCETVNGIYTGNVSQNLADKDVKRQIIQTYIKENDVNGQVSLGFGDTVTDLAFLEIVGYPVAVNPDNELEQIAKKNGWLICTHDTNIVESVRAYIS